MSEIKVNKISPRTACGTTTLGDSGDTFTIPAGVTITNNGTQTGFGRTGTVNWQTTIKTGDFTAVSGEGYFINTTSGAISMTLPASPSAGAIVSVKDYAQTFDNNALTVVRNGSNFNGGSSFDPSFSDEGAFLTFIYADSTKGWLVTDSSTNTQGAANTFVAATGGTITTSGDFKIHTFTGPGTFCISAAAGPVAIVDYMVVAGGGSGGPAHHGGGGGAGGFRESKSPTYAPSWTASPLVSTSSLPVSVQGYPVTVGAGGTAPSSAVNGVKGSNSIFSTITSTGGGGASAGPATPDDIINGGSGGGMRQTCSTNNNGSGNTPPVSPPQGNDGGTIPGSGTSPGYGASGGGGATTAGGTGTSAQGGAGGTGATTSINASPTAFAGGGGGSLFCGGGGGPGPGGTGGGGRGGLRNNYNGCAGTANTGGGGGGTERCTPSTNGGNGGSGIVIIRYKFQ